MQRLQFFLASLLLLGLYAAASAQTCTPPAQSCAAGPNGWGGCYVPGAAQCFSGMICETGASVCPPGKSGEGGCYDPRVARCHGGLLTRNIAPAPAPNDQRPDSSGVSTVASGEVCRPAVGEDRMAILGSLRTPVSSDLKTPVEFVVNRARICGNWAFVVATPQKAGGAAIAWARTVCSGDTSHLAGGLMRREGATWTLVEYALCPSDVAWSDWPEKFGAPQSLFDE